MAMARDDHYNSDSPVFYKNYELPRHQVRTVFLLRFYRAHDVLDTFYPICRYHVRLTDTPF